RMFTHQKFAVSFVVPSLLLFCSLASFAQFTSNIQGVVTDPSGAGIANAKVTLVNDATQAQSATTTDGSGNYRFVSLAPGAYKVTVEASGFAKSEVSIELLTAQNLAVPVTLKVGSVTEAVNVSAEA